MRLAGGQPAHRLVTGDFRSRLRSPHDSQKRQQRLRLGTCLCIFDCLPVPHRCPTCALPSPLPAACALACAQLDEMVSQLGQNVAEERAAVCDFMTELLDGLLTKVGMRGLDERKGGAQGWPWVERAVNSLVRPGCGSMGGSCLPALTVGSGASSRWSANRRSHWALNVGHQHPFPCPSNLPPQVQAARFLLAGHPFCWNGLSFAHAVASLETAAQQAQQQALPAALPGLPLPLPQLPLPPPAPAPAAQPDVTLSLQGQLQAPAALQKQLAELLAACAGGT